MLDFGVVEWDDGGALFCLEWWGLEEVVVAGDESGL